jgi:hypothetical protein
MYAQSFAVAGILAAALAYLVRHAIASHRAEKQRHSACSSCPIMKSAQPTSR